MIRPFGLNDVWLMRRLQRSGVPMAIEHMLTHPRDPLWTALTAPWPWAGKGVATFVLSQEGTGHRLSGFVQLMKRAARPEADLLYLAPAPSQETPPETAAGTIWSQLLNYCSFAAANHGLQRIFASFPDGVPGQDCLKDVGFSLYTRETIYRLAPPVVGNSQPGFRPQGPGDGWALQRLYARSTPHLVQQAEGATSGMVGSPSFPWWEPDSWQGSVWAPAGEMRGAVQVHMGRAGHWMRLLGSTGLAVREQRTLIEQGLHLITSERTQKTRHPLPVYVTVRDYDMGLSSALSGFGFAPYLDRTRFVRHTTVPVRESVLTSRPVVEARQEAPARSQSQWCK